MLLSQVLADSLWIRLENAPMTSSLDSRATDFQLALALKRHLVQLLLLQLPYLTQIWHAECPKDFALPPANGGTSA